VSVISPTTFLTALRDHGVHVIEADGWAKHTSAGGWNPRGVMHHHTAGNALLLTDRSTQEAMRRILWSGRPGLPGPLSHLGLAWQPWNNRAVAHTTGWGNCNHAGLGDGRVLRQVIEDRYDGMLGTREDTDGNPHFYGWEYMHPGDGTPWPDELVEIGARCGAAVCEAHGWTARSNLEHREWASRRKIDRSGKHDIRAEVARLLAGDDMALSPEDIEKVADAVWDRIKAREAWFIDKNRQGVQQEIGDENTGEFSDRVADKVVARSGSGVGDAGVLIARLLAELGNRITRPLP
jgi:hypothetical protein